MPSTYSQNLRIELIASGEQATTWGNTTNTNLGTLIEQAISGYKDIDCTTLNIYDQVVLTALDGASDDARNMILNLTGSPPSAFSLVAPAVAKFYVITNNSSETATVITAAVGSVGVDVEPNNTVIVYSDATDFHIAYTGVVLQTSPVGAAELPSGTTAERPAVPSTGFMRYNSTVDKFEGYLAGGWGSIGGGATGGGPDQVFVQNQLVVTTNYTLSAGYSASSVGPITVNSGVTVTIPSGYSWVIL